MTRRSRAWQLVGSLAREGRKETTSLHPRLVVGQWVAAAIPELVGGRTRAIVLRLAGVTIGHGTSVGGRISVVGELGAKGLHIGEHCFVNARCHFDVAGPIHLADGIALGQEVMILTGTHEIGDPSRRHGALLPLPVSVGRGAWIGARATILPGVTIGEGSIVGAGAVVTADVPPNTVVGGVPAKPLRTIDD